MSEKTRKILLMSHLSSRVYLIFQLVQDLTTGFWLVNLPALYYYSIDLENRQVQQFRIQMFSTNGQPAVLKSMLHDNQKVTYAF